MQVLDAHYSEPMLKSKQHRISSGDGKSSDSNERRSVLILDVQKGHLLSYAARRKIRCVKLADCHRAQRSFLQCINYVLFRERPVNAEYNAVEHWNGDNDGGCDDPNAPERSFAARNCRRFGAFFCRWRGHAEKY